MPERGCTGKLSRVNAARREPEPAGTAVTIRTQTPANLSVPAILRWWRTTPFTWTPDIPRRFCFRSCRNSQPTVRLTGIIQSVMSLRRPVETGTRPRRNRHGYELRPAQARFAEPLGSVGGRQTTSAHRTIARPETGFRRAESAAEEVLTSRIGGWREEPAWELTAMLQIDASDRGKNTARQTD